MKITIEKQDDLLSTQIEVNGQVAKWEDLSEDEQRFFLSSLATVYGMLIKFAK